MSEHHGIAAYAAYVPHHALVGNSLDGPPVDRANSTAPGRSVASYDEDCVTMAVEVLGGLSDLVVADSRLVLATTNAPYEGKTSSSIVHEALGLSSHVAALDLRGHRSGVTALDLVLRTGGIVAQADLRATRPGAPDELSQGDAAAAFVAGVGAAELLSTAAASVEILDRWRLPGERHDRVWDERFTAQVLVAAAQDAVQRAMSAAGLAEVDHVVVSSTNPRAATALRRSLKGDGADAAIERLTGFTGAAHPGLLLASILDLSAPGETILLVSASEGADALVFRASDSVRTARRGPSVAAQLDRRVPVGYGRYLRWRGLLDVQGPARPASPAPAAPPMHRRAGWKYRLEASKCGVCGKITTPPSGLCASCGRPAQTQAAGKVSLRDRIGTVTSVTQDRLTTMPETAVAMVIADFEGGGRLRAYAADVEANDVEIGMTMRPTFRRLWTTDGIHNYFWKLRPTSEAPVKGKTDGN
jgi:3-hydroxy-3-methylglutaryl CoA synthase/uncharacterized OB-fold protein